MTFTVTQTCSNCNSSVSDSVQLWEVLISSVIKESYHCPHHPISLWLLRRVDLYSAMRKYWIIHNWHAIWIDLSKNVPLPTIDIIARLVQFWLRSQTPLCWTHPRDRFNNSVSVSMVSMVSSLTLTTSDTATRFRHTPGRLTLPRTSGFTNILWETD